MDQMVTMTNKLRWPTRQHQMAIYKAIKSEDIFTSLLIQNREQSTFKNKSPTPIKGAYLNMTINLKMLALPLPKNNYFLTKILIFLLY